MSVLGIHGTVNALSLMLTFSQTFCLKTNVGSHSLQPLPNCQILLTSLFPEECNCILFPPRSCRVPAACQCKQLPSVPRRRAPEVREQRRRLHGLREACPCRVAGANTRSCTHWKPGYLVLLGREVGCVLPIPCGIGAGGAGTGARWLFLWQARCVWAASGQGPARDACLLFPVSSCSSLREPALERASLLCVTACASGSVSSITKSLGASPRGSPLLGLTGSLPWLVIPQIHEILSVEQYFLQGGASTSPTPALPHLLLPGAFLVKLLPAFLPRNNLFCCPDSWGLKGKSSTFRESLFVFPVSSLLNEQGSQLWHNSADSVPCYWE